jgi:hypothetical protein
MPTSNSHSINEIDYGSLHEQASEPEKAVEKKKTEGVASRSIKKQQSVAEAAPIDVNELAAKSSQMSKKLGEPKSPDGLTKYAPEILGGLGVLGALAAAHHHYTNNRLGYGESNAGKPPEPKPDMRNIGQAPVATPAATEPPVPKGWEDIIAKSNANAAAKAAEAAAKTNPVPTGYTQGLPSTVNPMSQFAGQPTTPAPVSVADAVAGGINPTQAVTQTIAQEIDAAPTELRTGTGKPAFAGQGPVAPVSKKGKTQFYENYGSLAEVPSTHAFIPNAQYIDPVRQDLGPKAYKEAYTVRNFPASNEIAREEAKTINRELGRATREEAKLAGLPPAEITPGITEKTTKGYKKVAVGGLGVGALVALPNLANAAQQGDAKAAAEAIGYAIPGISHLLSIRDINNAYKEGGWPAAAHMAADVASMGGLSGAEHLLSYVPKQKTEVPSINKPRLGAIPPAFSQFYR